VTVVVFDSADPDFFLATTTSRPISLLRRVADGPHSLHHWADFLIRLGKSPAVDDHRSCGAGTRCGQRVRPRHDIRFASRWSGPCWGSSRWVRRGARGRALDPSAGIVGRGRGVQILLGGEDFDGNSPSGTDTSNRAVPMRSSSGLMPSRTGLAFRPARAGRHQSAFVT